jgi:hypothetical protein
MRSVNGKAHSGNSMVNGNCDSVKVQAQPPKLRVIEIASHFGGISLNVLRKMFKFDCHILQLVADGIILSLRDAERRDYEAKVPTSSPPASRQNAKARSHVSETASDEPPNRREVMAAFKLGNTKYNKLTAMEKQVVDRFVTLDIGARTGKER